MNIERPFEVSSAQAPAVAADALKSFREIPGPSSLPFVGPLRHFLPGGDLYNLNRQELSDELYRIYGPIVRLEQLGKQPNIVFLYDADSVSKIYRSEDIAWPVRPNVGTLETYRQKNNKQDHIGVLINGLGPQWKKFRTPANRAMMNPKLVWQAYSKPLYEIAEDAVARFQSIRNENDMIPDFGEELKLWALESAGAVTLGRRLNCFSSHLEENSHEKRLILLINTLLSYIENVDFNYNSFTYMLFGRFKQKKIMNTYEELEKVILHFITQTLEDLESKNNSEFETCTIEKILRDNKQEALGVAMDSMMAGVDSVLFVFPHQVMCLMESHFPRAREFIPERWLVGQEHPLYYGNAHPFAHRPFGFGIRTCIGQRIAELTTEAIVVNMVKTFDFKWEGAPPTITPSTVNKMEKPFNFVFKKYNKSSN